LWRGRRHDSPVEWQEEAHRGGMERLGLRSLTGLLTLLESNVHCKLISCVLGVFVVVGVRSEPRIFSGRIGPISRIGPMGVLLVARVMRSRHADGAPRMASSINGHWLGALSNCEHPPPFGIARTSLRSRPAAGFLSRQDSVVEFVRVEFSTTAGPPCSTARVGKDRAGRSLLSRPECCHGRNQSP